MKDIIDALYGAGFKLTLYEIDGNFCLAIRVRDPSEMFHIGGWAAENKSYLGRCFYSERNKSAYFPELRIDKEGYELICGR